MIKRLLPKNNRYQRLAIVLLSSLVIAACSKEQAAVPPPAPPQQPKPAAAVPLKPVQKQVSSALRLPPPVAINQFDFSKKKDPFKPYIEVKPEQKKSDDTFMKMRRNSLPIHSFDVSQFKLIGIISGGRENKAMVTDPGGKGYVLKVGMTIGKNEGKIVNINANGVDVLEQFKDDSGRVRKENIKLTLPRKQ